MVGPAGDTKARIIYDRTIFRSLFRPLLESFKIFIIFCIFILYDTYKIFWRIKSCFFWFFSDEKHCRSIIFKFINENNLFFYIRVLHLQIWLQIQIHFHLQIQVLFWSVFIPFSSSSKSCFNCSNNLLSSSVNKVTTGKYSLVSISYFRWCIWWIMNFSYCRISFCFAY